MRLGERRRPFQGRSRLRTGEKGLTGRITSPGYSRRQMLVSRSSSLVLMLILMGMLLYALVKFFEMMRVRGFGLWRLWFVPAGMIVVLFVLLRAARSLLRQMVAKPPSE